jgi:hypothetical protein
MSTHRARDKAERTEGRPGTDPERRTDNDAATNSRQPSRPVTTGERQAEINRENDPPA